MLCPYCGVEMLHGYLNCGAALWSDRRHVVSLNPDGEERWALRLKVPMVTPNCVESDCCPRCRRIILDASPYESHL